PGPLILLLFLAICVFVPGLDCQAVWEGPYVSERTYPWDQPESQKQVPDPPKTAKRETIKDKAEEKLYFYTHGNILSSTGADSLELRHLPDGAYRGSYPDYGGQGIVLDLVVRDGKITDIKIISSRNDMYVQKAGKIIKRVKAEQSLEVDTVTGATVTSEAILGAIHDAVSKAMKTRRYRDDKSDL
ncbi:MAG: FMN-binding protein, partial [Candidatus Omnitrophica bacterium]|nr:FMN-binding protein [Candidatus Omnitrophota bacterium]